MYVDIMYDSKKNIVKVSEIHNGKTILQDYQPVMFFYIEDDRGSYVGINDKRLSKITCKTSKQYRNEIYKYRNMGIPTYEASVKVIFKTLEQYYSNQKTEKLNKTYFDIETDFDRTLGFASPADPFNRITAISLYNSWEDILYSLSLHPKGMTMEEAEALLEGIPNNIICETEEQMLEMFFELTRDTNVFLGWNSNFFDIPYMVNRTKRVLGNDATKNFCLWNQFPKPVEKVQFGKTHEVYELVGKVHLDMLELYTKYTYSELASFRLDYVAEIEVKEKKVPYEGTLDALYNNDYRKFIMYSRQDTGLLKKIDDVKKHVDLAFKIAYENLVNVQTVLGAVALSDNAIVLEAHRRNLRVLDRDKSSSNDNQIPGGWAIDPKTGLVKYLGAVDMTSLYPSVFRALNMSPETIVGQITQFKTEPYLQARRDAGMSNAEVWAGMFNVFEVDMIINKTDDELELVTPDGDSIKMPAKDMHDFIFENHMIMSANGTIFRTDKQGVIPSLLERWFNERVQFQARAKNYKLLAGDGIPLPNNILEQLKEA